MASSTSERNFIIEVPPKNRSFPEHHLLLSSFKLPQNILDAYNKKNIKSIFSWQYKCLYTGVLTGRSLVISAPTSAGKMLIAELAAIMTILSRKKKVLIVMPFVSAVLEARSNFQSLLSGQQVRVEAFTGSNSQDGDFLNKDIAICTLEKGYSLLMDVFLAKKKYELGLVIIDELHMIGEAGRGSILELLLMKILYSYQKQSVQLLGMSATLPNGKKLAKWLNAEYYVTDFRPIELKEKILIDNRLHQKTGSNQISSKFKTIDGDPVEYFCRQRILKDQSVLVFCSTKNACRYLASALAGNLPEQTQKHLEVEALKNVCQNLSNSEAEKTLEKIIPKGVGYHHAGLSFECRKNIQEAFRKKQLKVLVATTTLSMGVNLPAHLVIVKGPRDGIQCPLATRMYKQMVGRAGRKGLVDGHSESILMCDRSEKDVGENLFLSKVEPSCSRLCSENKYEEIALRKGLMDRTTDLVSHNKITQQELSAYFSFSFYYRENKKSMNECQSAMQFLQDNHFITKEEVSSTEQGIHVLPLGLAARTAKFSPEFALIVFQELKKIEGKPNPPVEFAIYLVALVMDRLCLIKEKWNKEIFKLPEKAEEILSAMNADTGIRTTSAFIVLYEIMIHKTSLDDIAEKYPITALKLKDLQDEIKKFVSTVILFSEKLEWCKRFVDILRKCKDRISNSKKISTSSASNVGTKRARSPDSDGTAFPPPKKTRKSNVMKEVPKLRELRLLKSPNGEKIRIINEAASNWRTIGDILEFDDSGSKVSTIEERREAVRDHFKLWLRGSCENFLPATWETLIALLKDADLVTLANKVEDAINSL